MSVKFSPWFKAVQQQLMISPAPAEDGEHVFAKIKNGGLGSRRRIVIALQAIFSPTEADAQQRAADT